MTKRKSDGGPERGDGESPGVSGGEPRGLPSWACQPMIDSAAIKHRIVHAWHIEAGYLFVLGSDGRILWRDVRSEWHEIATYPPGLEP